MSFEINWDQLISDNVINDSIKEFLHHQFLNISLPLYINNLSVTNFSLGDQAPEVIVRHIGDPFDDFYEEEGDEKDDTRENEGEDEDEEEDDDNDGETTNASISEDMTTNHINDQGHPPIKPSPPPLERLRTSLDSVSLMLGNSSLNYMHNYNMNNIIGLGPNNGTETPMAIINPNPRKPSQLRVQHSEASLRAGEKAHEKDVNDIQLIAEIKYSGNLHIEVVVNLLVNYPSPNFISLPIKLHITDLVIHSIATIAYLKKSIFLSFLCDIDDTTSDYFTLSSNSTEPSRTPPLNSGGNFVDYMAGPNNRERIDIIKNIRIESEIGEVENNILRNVGKVEKFLIDQLRSIIRDEVAWPSWVCFDMNDDEESDDEATNTP